MAKNNLVSLYVIGTELTRGIISDKHIPLLTTELTHMGYVVKRAEIVPDDGTIEKSLEMGASDSDLLIITGGLGPTSDDMTRNIISSLAGVELEKNQSAWDTLYKRVGERIHGANEIQAMIPHGFEIIENPNGTAPGFRGKFSKDNHVVEVIAMPGPPAEMQPMFYNLVKPYLSSRIGYTEEERDEYSVYLIAEAKLEELCQMCRIEGVGWGTRFQQFKISLYITGKKESRKLFIEKLRKLVGFGLIVDGDDRDASVLFAEFLKNNKFTVSCAESCTCGLIAKMLTDLPGSSAWFWGGAATYANQAKVSMLGVKQETLDKYGAVSSQTAAEMACGIRSVSKTDFSVSVTGIAGPDGGSEAKPVGTVFFGFDSEKYGCATVGLKMSVYSRDASRRRFATAAFILARMYAQGINIVDTVNTWMYI